MKISQLIVSFFLIGNAHAFVPSTFARPNALTRVFSTEAETESPPAPAAPVAPSPPASSAGGKIVPVNQETVEFTAGIVGGVAGFAIGGPVLGAVFAAAANYASKNEAEIGEVVTAVSKSSIEVYNYLSKLDSKYEVLDNAKKTLESTLEKVKSSENADPAVVEKVEKALSSTTSKIKEINDEYDLVGAGATALGVIGDLVERAVKKAGELNEDYKLSERALESIKSAASSAAAKAANKA